MVSFKTNHCILVEFKRQYSTCAVIVTPCFIRIIIRDELNTQMKYSIRTQLVRSVRPRNHFVAETEVVV